MKLFILFLTATVSTAVFAEDVNAKPEETKYIFDNLREQFKTAKVPTEKDITGLVPWLKCNIFLPHGTYGLWAPGIQFKKRKESDNVFETFFLGGGLYTSHLTLKHSSFSGSISYNQFDSANFYVRLVDSGHMIVETVPTNFEIEGPQSISEPDLKVGTYWDCNLIKE